MWLFGSARDSRDSYGLKHFSFELFSDMRSFPWQILLLWIYSLVLGFVFMLAAWGTSSQWATVIYEVATFIFGGVLFIVKGIYFRNREMPFEFSLNAPAYAYSLAVLLVPLIYFLAVALNWFLTGQLDTGALIPEVFRRFLSLTDLPSVLPQLGPLGPVVQEFALQLSDVGPAEELFKTAVTNGLLVVILWYAQTRKWAGFKIGKGSTFLMFTGINGLWTLMHGILAYHSASDFLVAFVAGEVIMAPTWFFGNPFPGVIAHGDWNALSSFQLLTLPVMLLLALVFLPLTLLLYVRRKHK